MFYISDFAKIWYLIHVGALKVKPNFDSLWSALYVINIQAEVAIWIPGMDLINVNLETSGPEIFGIYIYKLNSRNPNCHLCL